MQMLENAPLFSWRWIRTDLISINEIPSWRSVEAQGGDRNFLRSYEKHLFTTDSALRTSQGRGLLWSNLMNHWVYWGSWKVCGWEATYRNTDDSLAVTISRAQLDPSAAHLSPESPLLKWYSWYHIWERPCKYCRFPRLHETFEFYLFVEYPKPFPCIQESYFNSEEISFQQAIFLLSNLLLHFLWRKDFSCMSWISFRVFESSVNHINPPCTEHG